MKIAILDDDERIRISISLLLQALGHIPKAFATEQDMFAEIKAFEPEMIVLDQMLGGKRTGIQLVEELRRSYPRLKIVIVSGYPQSELTRAVELNGVSFLAKPFSLESLARQIGRQESNDLKRNAER